MLPADNGENRKMRKVQAVPALFKNDNTSQARAAVRDDLSWTHYCFLIRIENKQRRDFYLNECADNNWSTRQLERQINSHLYERMLLSKDKKGVIQHANKQDKPMQASDIIKDPYILDFLDLKGNKRVLESNLENAIISKLQEFILELGAELKAHPCAALH